MYKWQAVLELSLPQATCSVTWVSSRYSAVATLGIVYGNPSACAALDTDNFNLFCACKTCLGCKISWMYVPVDTHSVCGWSIAESPSAVNNWYPFPHMERERQNRVNFLVWGNNLMSGSGLKTTTLRFKVQWAHHYFYGTNIIFKGVNYLQLIELFC